MIWERTRLRNAHVNVDLAVIGGGLIILYDVYDPDQEWLPFMQGTVLGAIPKHPEPGFQLKPEKYRTQIRNRRKQKRIVSTAIERQMYVPMEGQYGLPFTEHKEEKNYKIIETWDKFQPERPKDRRMKMPKPRNFQHYVPLKDHELEEWLGRLRGRYQRFSTQVTFERESDWLFAKLSFQK